MHSKEQIKSIVCKHLVEIAGKDQVIDGQTNLAETVALDSVKVLDLLMEIEDEFDVSVPLNLMADVQTVNDLVDVIQNIESKK